MTPESIKKKKEELVKKHNTLRDKIEEGKNAIRNMEAQLNGLVGAVQLCDDLINNPEEPKKDKRWTFGTQKINRRFSAK